LTTDNIESHAQVVCVAGKRSYGCGGETCGLRVEPQFSLAPFLLVLLAFPCQTKVMGVLRIMELNMLEGLPERTATTMNLQCHEKHKTTQKR
jgi:hypothetical protein